MPKQIAGEVVFWICTSTGFECQNLYYGYTGSFCVLPSRVLATSGQKNVKEFV
jgi:hypothetical protein